MAAQTGGVMDDSEIAMAVAEFERRVGAANIFPQHGSTVFRLTMPTAFSWG